MYYLRYKNKVAKMIRDGDRMIDEWRKEEGNAERDPADSPIILGAAKRAKALYMATEEIWQSIPDIKRFFYKP